MSRSGGSRSPEILAEGVLRGERRAIARLITSIESGVADASAALRMLYSATGRSHVVGVTGPPGAGKSTLVGRLGAEARRQGRRVAVLAFDPSSPYSGGALLGDRIRMSDLVDDPGAYVRSMATRGSHGGLARAARDAVRVVEAAGFDLVLVETVGAGQADLDVTVLAQTTVVVAVPELGDEIQALKAGLYEAADVFALNKSDLAGADEAALALELSAERGSSDWRPPIVRCVATTGEGVAELASAIDAHRRHLAANGNLAERVRSVARSEVIEALRDEVVARLMRGTGRADLEAEIEGVARREVDAATAARRALETLLDGRANQASVKSQEVL